MTIHTTALSIFLFLLAYHSCSCSYCRVPARCGLQDTLPGLRAATRHRARDPLVRPQVERNEPHTWFTYLLRQGEPGTSHYINILCIYLISMCFVLITYSLLPWLQIINIFVYLLPFYFCLFICLLIYFLFHSRNREVTQRSPWVTQ